ncbi:MAG: UDP-2,3-diacylglucosamine diphosphatase [Odoribacteraceae bacterium]|jgi:UDP-2,3-diacylglucosamine hydrolase|nr:UDP-2,3-diacylglucosamine diphosphatase [Odoribacteraceae bacterium]
MQDKRVFFLSDAHLGAKFLRDDRERERKLVAFLERIATGCEALYLLGDMFDFWFEYKRVVPRGHVRFLGLLARLTDAGIPVHFFTGNHDAWAFDYLRDECGVTLHHRDEWLTLHGKQFLVGHGDGLNPADKRYLLLRRAFRSPALQRAFRLLHPDAGIRLANGWSARSRARRGGLVEAPPYRGDDREGIVLYCKRVLQERHVDYFIFGHRHLPADVLLAPGSHYINTGDWISHFSYATFDGSTVKLLREA